MKNYLDRHGHFIAEIDESEDFDRLSRDLLRDYENQRAYSGRIPRGDALAANDWFKRIAYQLIAELIKADREDIFHDRIERYGRRQRGKRGNPNPFQDGLFALCAHAKKNVLGPRDRELWGNQFEFAYCHHVPPVFLPAFLAKYWSNRTCGKNGNYLIMPTFEPWILNESLNAASREAENRRRVTNAVTRLVRVLDSIHDGTWDDDDDFEGGSGEE